MGNFNKRKKERKIIKKENESKYIRIKLKERKKERKTKKRK